jgi:FKBP-type peptidyl-prolyl cis-trans isomerase
MAIRIQPLLFLCLITVLVGCKPKYTHQEMPAVVPYPDQESIYRSNQSMIRQNTKMIRDRAALKGWVLKDTGTGVFYQVLKSGKAIRESKIEPGDVVSLDFRLSLLDGQELYSSKNQGPKQFVVEKSEAEAGLHEAVQYLHPGDSARIVIPPHRAFGLTGDGNKIPPRAILVYEIRVDSVIRHVNK